MRPTSLGSTAVWVLARYREVTLDRAYICVLAFTWIVYPQISEGKRHVHSTRTFCMKAPQTDVLEGRKRQRFADAEDPSCLNHQTSKSPTWMGREV